MSKTGGVRYCEKDVLDTFEPDWQNTDPVEPDYSKYYKHYMHDTRDPTRFYLYPRPKTFIPVWVLYAALPDEVTALGDDFPLSDEYLDAVVQYVLYRAFLKEGRYSNGPDNKRQELWQAYLQALGLSRAVAQSISPELEMHRPPGGSAA